MGPDEGPLVGEKVVGEKVGFSDGLNVGPAEGAAVGE